MKTFEKQTAKDFNNLITCIDSIFMSMQEYTLLKMVAQDLKCDGRYFEYGFNIKSKIKGNKDNIFVGLWFDYWEVSGFPFVLSLGRNTKYSDKVNAEMKRIQALHPTLFDQFQIYDDWPVLAISANAIYNEEHHPLLVQIIYNLCKFAGI